MKSKTPASVRPCIFCHNPRTNKRGEHVFDNWLNREHGKEIRRPGFVIEFGKDDAIERKYPSNSIQVTKAVVCDDCNNTWMSDLTGFSKDIREPSMRRSEPKALSDFDVCWLLLHSFL